MIDLTNLTPDQANKIEMVLLLLEGDFRKHIEANEALSLDYDLPDEGRKAFEANVKWYKEAYHLIYGKEYTK